jgi:hypothetical protein
VNHYTNDNAESLIKWIFRKNDHLPIISLYFLSRRYGTSNRYFPLLNASSKIRIVVVSGSRFPGGDRILLRIYPFIFKIFKKKISSYKWHFGSNFSLANILDINCLIDFDDPNYTLNDVETIKDWETKQLKKNKYSKLVFTNTYAKDFFESKGITSEAYVIPQGHSSQISIRSSSDAIKASELKIVYVSPIIATTGDQEEGHVNWDITSFIENIWLKLPNASGIQLHLIGDVRKNVRLKLTGTNVIYHGLVPIQECGKIMNSLDIGIYPRTQDNFRQAQKIVEYLGAGLPILTYDLVDTSLVKDFNCGWVVQHSSEFIQKLLELQKNPRQVVEKKDNVFATFDQFSCINLAARLEKIMTEL